MNDVETKLINGAGIIQRIQRSLVQKKIKIIIISEGIMKGMADGED